MKVKDLANEVYYDEEVKSVWLDYDVVIFPGLNSILVNDLTDVNGFIHPISIMWDHDNKRMVLEL